MLPLAHTTLSPVPQLDDLCLSHLFPPLCPPVLQDEASTGPASISASAQTASTSLTASGLGLSRSTSTNLGPAASGAGQTGAGAEGADTAVSSAACLSLFLAYFVLPASAGGTMRLRDSAMQVRRRGVKGRFRWMDTRESPCFLSMNSLVVTAMIRCCCVKPSNRELHCV